MTKIIDIETSKYQLSELLAMVRSGDEVIVQEADTPVARIAAIPVSDTSPKPFVFGLSAPSNTESESTFWMSEDFDDELPIEFWLGEDA